MRKKDENIIYYMCIRIMNSVIIYVQPTFYFICTCNCLDQK